MAEVKTNLRLSEEMYAQVKQLAGKELRSINAQMVILIQEAMAQRRRAAKRDAEAENQP